MGAYRDLLKHSSIYGLGQILSRLASIVLLPLYTYYLRPADYGILAILDLVAGLMALLIGSGMASAVYRFHFEFEDETHRARVWWTGLVFVTISATAIVLPAWFVRDQLAVFTLGADELNGGDYFALALLTVWFNCVGQLPDSYLRVRKWSGLSVLLSLVRLLLNIGLNIYFLTVLGMGVQAILLGNLITAGIMTCAVSLILMANERSIVIDCTLMKKLLAFGAPLIATGLLSTMMHQADRYLLRLFVSMDEVGVYSLAYQVAQGVNTLFLLPFTAIWGVVVYEIARHKNAKDMFANVFQNFSNGLALLMLAASLFARPVLSMLVAEDYSTAADLVPVVCLAYYFFSLHEHFRVPVLLAKRTLNLIPVFLLATAVNLAANLALLPLMGAQGAAWASVITFATFSLFGLYRYRKIDSYPYPFARCAVVLVGMGATYATCRHLHDHVGDWSIGISFVVWAIWAVVLFGRHAIGCLHIDHKRPNSERVDEKAIPAGVGQS